MNLKIYYQTLKQKTLSGGSVANSVVGLSQLENKVGFIGKVSDDSFGKKYEEGLKKENVEYIYNKKETLPTGTCLIHYTRLRGQCVFFWEPLEKSVKMM